MKLNINKSVVVITPTVNSTKLQDAIESVKNQTYKNIEHLVVLDGIEYLKDTTGLPSYVTPSIVPYNTGANGYYGHRIYAAYSHLVKQDYVIFLDEDNWFKEDHIETLVNTLETNAYDFAHSLRSIYSLDKTYLLDDNCESLGSYPIFGDGRNGHLVDTSSYLFKREFLIQYGHVWHSGWGADRNFFNTVRSHSRYGCTGKHTLCYRLDGNPNSVNESFFKQGNDLTKKLYGEYPWNK